MMIPLEMRKGIAPMTLVRRETYQTTTTHGPPVYSGSFSKFIMSIAHLENLKFLTTLKPYDGIGDL